MFADTAQIQIRAGRGGDGALSFRHEKYRAKGGPDGGDGGRGGSVIFRIDPNLNTLSHYRTARLIQAQDGQSGRDNRKHGKSGEDSYIPVPAGTQIWEGEQLLADLTGSVTEAILARGGRGGFGNAHFTASTRQAPRLAERGEPGETKDLRLELKLIADIGLIGLPNAGKSTLLSVISNARPEIADYAFTTIIPNLGVVNHRDDTFLVADIPGLIQGAHAGKGLGDDFLRHIERTSVLIHLIDATSPDVAHDYQTIQHELASYQVDLSTRPQIVTLTKTDALPSEDLDQRQAALTEAAGTSVLTISAQAHQGLTQLLDAAMAQVQTAQAARAQAEAQAALPVITLEDLPDAWAVQPEAAGVFRVTGQRLEGFARRTNFDQDDAVQRLRDILRKTGVATELRRQGAQSGDTIRIADQELAWIEP